MSDMTKAVQNYDSNPPRCGTCAYFRREPHTLFTTKITTTRRGKSRTIRVPLRKHPLTNPIVERCSFGNFITKAHAVCDEWHSPQGERIETGSATATANQCPQPGCSQTDGKPCTFAKCPQRGTQG